eukprot:2689906-Rhodomonas_salina.2
MSGIDLGYAATRREGGHVSSSPASLRTRYAMPGTDLACVISAYARATRCPVLTERIVLPGTQRD